MASRIKGITVEIGGDTTGLDKALKSVNSSIKTTQSGLKDVSKLLRLDPTNTELLTQKQKLLKDAIGSTKEKQIKLGYVSVTDPNNSLYRYTNYENTLEAIREKLVNRLGGYLRLRHVDDQLILDWVSIEQYGNYSTQPIEFGLNLLDYSETTSAEDVVTALIPLGATLEGESEIEALEKRVDITSVNDGKNYVSHNTMWRTITRLSSTRTPSRWCSGKWRSAARAGSTTVASTPSPVKSAAVSAAAGTAQRYGTPTASTGRSSGSAITNSMATGIAAPRT